MGEGFADLAPRKLPLTPGFAVPSPLGEGRINCSPAASPNVETPAHGESRCEKIVGYRPMRLRACCAPRPDGVSGESLRLSGKRQSRDVFTPSKPWEEGGIYLFTK